MFTQTVLVEELFNVFILEFLEIKKNFNLPISNKILLFSLFLFIILLSPIVLRKLRVPSIIGLIIAGVVIGPHGAAIVSEQNTTDGYIGLFSTFGLLYIMFMAGLELDLQEFKRFRKKSITFGALTFIIPLVLGYPLCRFVLNMNELAALITALMFSTHTLVAFPIVSKYGLAKKEAVGIAIGGTIITDTLVLILISLLTGSSKNGDTRIHFDGNQMIHYAVTISIFSLVMFWLVPRIAKWFFQKLESEKHSQYIFVLSVLFFAAFLAEAANLEPMIGAFCTGLIMGRLIPHTSTLMNRIEFIGNALFIPFFLIFIGMNVELGRLGFIWRPWKIAIVLTSFAILSKFLASWATQLIFKMRASERNLIFGLSNAHAAATLAIIKSAHEMKLIDVSVVNGTVILILITSMVASFVTENAGKKYLIDSGKDEKLEELTLRSQHVMVAANELKGNESLLDFSVLITDRSVINPISVVSVLQNDEMVEFNIRRSRKHLDDFVTHYSSGEISIHAMATIDHNISSGIGRVSKELVADVVLINDQSSSNILKRIVGDDREHLIQSCDKSIFFCQFDLSFSKYKKISIVCPPLAELEPSCNQWLERVMRVAKVLGLNLNVHCTRETFEKVKTYRTDRKYGIDLLHFEMPSMEEMIPNLASIPRDHLLISVFARLGSISSFVGCESMASRFEKENPYLDRLFIYPAQMNSEFVNFTAYEDMNSSPIKAGVETITKISKEVGDLFKKTDKNEENKDI